MAAMVGGIFTRVVVLMLTRVVVLMMTVSVVMLLVMIMRMVLHSSVDDWQRSSSSRQFADRALLFCRLGIRNSRTSEDLFKLDRFDVQFFALEPCEAERAARTRCQHRRGRKFSVARLAARDRCNLADVETCILDFGSLGYLWEPERDRIRHYTGQLADLDRDPIDLAAFRSVGHQFDDTARDRKFVHGGPSANARQLLADEHVNDAVAAEDGVHGHPSRLRERYAADDACSTAQRVRA